MTPSVEVFNTAVQQHTFHDDDPLLDLSNSSDDPPPSADNQNITKPGEHDVLLGRGGGTNNHSGNIKFRKLVNEHKMRYLACSKVDKPKVAREVVQLWRKMSPPGRFLARKDESKRGPGSVKSADNVWFEVGDKKAREKASQCLRERTPDVMPYIKHLREQQDAITEQGVSMVQKHLQMQQNDRNGGGGGPSPQSQQPFAEYVSPGTNQRNTLSVPSFGARADPAMTMSAPQQPAPFGNNAYDARTKMVASMGHPNVGAYSMQQQQQLQQQQNLHGSMSSVGHSSFSSHGGGGASSQPVTAAELYGEDDFYVQQHQQQPQQQPPHLHGDDVEYQRNMMLMQQQVHMQQLQMRRMQQQRMQQQQMQQQQLQQQQMQQRQMQMQHQQMHQQQFQQQQQQHMHQHPHHQQQQHSAISAASLFQASPEPAAEPYAVQSDPLFGDLANDSSSSHHHNEAAQLQQQEAPRVPPTRKAPVRPALKQQTKPKRGRDAPEERAAPDRATSLMSITPQEEGGEITIEEYRKQLEEYIENNQIQSSLGNATDDDDDDDCPSDLEDDWEKEREKNMQRQQQDKKRGVGRNVSGCSLMSAKTTKSNLSMVSGISAGMFSADPSEDTRENMKSSRSLCSSLSLMSELTDLSHNIDNLGLDD